MSNASRDISSFCISLLRSLYFVAYRSSIQTCSPRYDDRCEGALKGDLTWILSTQQSNANISMESHSIDMASKLTSF